MDSLQIWVLPMNETVSNYVGKARRYAQFRWDYAPPAIAWLCGEVGLRNEQWVADIGAGPGTLARWFVERGLEVWAVEPEAEMRRLAEERLGHRANFHSVSACAEQTRLPDASVSLIVAGRALHWFHPETARQEFLRISQPDGWLATLAVHCMNPALGAAMKALATPANGFDLSRSKRNRLAATMDFYVRHVDRPARGFPAEAREDWPDFIGRLSTFSGAPDPQDPAFAVLEDAAHQVFTRFAVGGTLVIPVETHVQLGRLRR